jgi:Ca-activated chloride channel homolog
VLSEGGQGGSILVLADEANAIQAAAPGGAPVMLLPMLPPGRDPAAGLQSAARAFDAKIIHSTVDTADVATIGRRLAQPGRSAARPDAGDRWQDGGWYLVPLLALIVSLWFRRGWAVLG